jgi:uncharacterized 2Fe-2S/4Fe-4S cluster protein (DUF4445 family)
MPTLTVIHAGAVLDVPLPVGSTVREALEAADVPVRWGCSGNGACGLCVVRVHAGVTNDPTGNELLLVPAGQLESGIRLACQLTPQEDICVEVLGAASSQVVSGATPIRVSPGGSDAAVPARRGIVGYGIAVDVGTTHVRVSLCDLGSGDRVAMSVVDNPQSRFGADVVTRLVGASDSTHTAKKIAQLLVDAIRDALGHACASAGVDPGWIVSARVVGNTPMLLLMTRGDPRSLLEPDSWTSPMKGRFDGAEEWARTFGIESGASIEVVQPLAGFVGSDLLAAVLATRLDNGSKCLLIDFGTNSEIALWDGMTLWVTSAAGGPAFESFGISCGMPAETGAISGVQWDDGPDELCYDVIGGGQAKGLCGSGFVDLVAHLRATGDLSAVGRLAENHEDGFAVQAEGPVRLTNRDIDTFQRAKAAIGAGVATLLRMARVEQTDIARVCVCGAFGRHLNPLSATRIGLLPDVPPGRVEIFEEAAVAGCERLLVETSSRAELDSLRAKTVVVNLAQTPDFDELFLDNLYLRPLEVVVT